MKNEVIKPFEIGNFHHEEEQLSVSTKEIQSFSNSRISKFTEEVCRFDLPIRQGKTFFETKKNK